MNSQLGSAAVARFLRGVAVVFLVVTIVFVLGRATGDPISYFAPLEATADEIEGIKDEFGLNDPIIEQYGRFLVDTVQLDFGRSFRAHRPAMEVLRERVFNTVLLGIVALIFAFSVGIPFGIIAAVRRGVVVDLFARMFALLGQAVPNFWLGLMLILFLAVNVDFFPTGGRVGFTSIILPGITLGAFPAAAVMRFTRSSMLDTLQQDYIRTAAPRGSASAQSSAGTHCATRCSRSSPCWDSRSARSSPARSSWRRSSPGPGWGS